MKSDYFKLIDNFTENIRNELEKLKKEEKIKHNKSKKIIEMFENHQELNVDSKISIEKNGQDLILIKNEIGYYNAKV